MKLSKFIPEIKIYPNSNIDTNEKLLQFINKNKEKVIDKLINENGYDLYNENDYHEYLMDKKPIIFRDNQNPKAWWQGTVKLGNYYLTVEDDFNNEKPIEVNGVKIYWR